MTTLVLPNAEATHAFGQCLGQTLPPGTVLLLHGDLGSGKTALVQGIGQGLGITETIDSPTFTLINEYTSGRIPLYHLDLYRLEPEQVIDLHLDLYWEATEATPGLMAIEWADRLPHFPDHYLTLRLAITPQASPTDPPHRHLTLDPQGTEALQWLQHIAPCLEV